jgi:hypothetical protein
VAVTSCRGSSTFLVVGLALLRGFHRAADAVHDEDDDSILIGLLATEMAAQPLASATGLPGLKTATLRQVATGMRTASSWSFGTAFRALQGGGCAGPDEAMVWGDPEEDTCPGEKPVCTPAFAFGIVTRILG